MSMVVLAKRATHGQFAKDWPYIQVLSCIGPLIHKQLWPWSFVLAYVSPVADE